MFGVNVAQSLGEGRRALTEALWIIVAVVAWVLGRHYERRGHKVEIDNAVGIGLSLSAIRAECDAFFAEVKSGPAVRPATEINTMVDRAEKLLDSLAEVRPYADDLDGLLRRVKNSMADGLCAANPNLKDLLERSASLHEVARSASIASRKSPIRSTVAGFIARCLWHGVGGERLGPPEKPNDLR
jgi:hypothetical protein